MPALLVQERSCMSGRLTSRLLGETTYLSFRNRRVTRATMALTSWQTKVNSLKAFVHAFRSWRKKYLRREWAALIYSWRLRLGCVFCSTDIQVLFVEPRHWHLENKSNFKNLLEWMLISLSFLNKVTVFFQITIFRKVRETNFNSKSVLKFDSAHFGTLIDLC